MKIISGNADAVTCAGSMFTIVSGGKVIDTVRKQGSTSDAVTRVVDGRSVITFTLKTKTGDYKIECTPAEWRDVSDGRGLIDRVIVVAKKTASNINQQITRGKKCCGNKG